MIDWIHQLACDWGHWLRKAEAKQGAVQGTLGRIKDEGLDGASIRSHAQTIPCVDFPADVQEFHRAWLRIDDDCHKLLWIDYKLRKSVKSKFKMMGKSKDAYYRLRSRAHMQIVGLMNDENSFRERLKKA